MPTALYTGHLNMRPGPLEPMLIITALRMLLTDTTDIRLVQLSVLHTCACDES
jgi:hypothetical protein